VNSTRYWESGIYGLGLYETADDGMTFVNLGSLSHIDSVSIDFSDTDRKTFLAGGHEQAQTLYRSIDGGMTWTNIGAGLPLNTNCTRPLFVDSQTYLVGCGGYGGGPTGIYRTTDGGTTWTRVTASGGESIPLRGPDKSIYWESSSGLTRSTDNGQTWVDVAPAGTIKGQPILLPDGRLAALGQRYVMVSSDQGVTWRAATSALPFRATDNVGGVVYSSQEKAFYAWYNTCGFSGPLLVPTDSIMRFDFDYQKN